MVRAHGAVRKGLGFRVVVRAHGNGAAACRHEEA